ncbi:hypothetical protein ERC79_06685 [Rhodococcus sp. ABRD24]|uniref:hypothetical protein n=1 Tax=Rhodococcus sp. ABRD24 TaxID=2507582 RepID=UPI00103B4F1E|nr:hypothetical protein [Rhodococcus sp. ABRD24]QBJ95688.1 hypothetical protein ERC79_06685 [Rhodococcus sp. ABRD24]
MHLRTRNILARTLGGVALITASTLAVPALATAAPAVKAPTITANSVANTIAVTVKNTNTDRSMSCGAFAIPESRTSELQADPSKILEPGFAIWKTAKADRVAASSTKSYTTPNLDGGLYAVFGECTSASSPTPVLSQPKGVSLPEDAMLGSLKNGGLENIIEFVTTGKVDALISALTTGSAQPAE